MEDANKQTADTTDVMMTNVSESSIRETHWTTTTAVVQSKVQALLLFTSLKWSISRGGDLF